MRTEDGYIIQECLNGETEAFGVLVDKYREGIYAFIYAKLRNFQDAQDVTQEVFLHAYRNLRTLRRWESFAAWLYRIASRRCKLWIRAASRRIDRDFVEDQASKIVDAPSLDSYRENQVCESVGEALSSLPEVHREVLVLSYFGGMNSKEIARAIGVSPAAIRMRLTRAREQLKEEMIAMMDTAFEGQRLPMGFTLRVVEAVKRIKVHPMPRMAEVSLGLSLVAGIIITVLSLNPRMNILNPLSFPRSSPLPVEAKPLETGEVPVDILTDSRMLAISGKQEDIAEAFLVAETRIASDDGWIVFSRVVPGMVEMWVIDANGKNEKRLAQGWFPNYSPDGRQIAFSHNDDIYVMNADGSNVRRLTNGPEEEFNPAWSPNGKQIAYAHRKWEKRNDGKWEVKGSICVIDADGTNMKNLTGMIQNHDYGYTGVDWSPDGKRIASGDNTWNGPNLIGRPISVMDADGGNQEILANFGEEPNWSPDGKMIVFTRDADNTHGPNDIYVMEADGTNIRRLTDPDPARHRDPCWSPDGKRIVFCSDRDDPGSYISDIYIMNDDGSGIQRLTNTPEDELLLDWTAFSYAVEPGEKLPTMWGETKTH